MLTRFLSSCAALAVVIAMLAACAESTPVTAPATPAPAVETAPQPAETAATQPSANAALIPYPLDLCLVSDEPLGSMGDPFVIAHEGREINLCCSGCEDMFKKDPAKYLVKLAPAAEPSSALDASAAITLVAAASAACCTTDCDTCCGNACATCCADGCETEGGEGCCTVATAECCCVDAPAAV